MVTGQCPITAQVDPIPAAGSAAVSKTTTLPKRPSEMLGEIDIEVERKSCGTVNQSGCVRLPTNNLSHELPNPVVKFNGAGRTCPPRRGSHPINREGWRAAGVRSGKWCGGKPVEALRKSPDGVQFWQDELSSGDGAKPRLPGQTTGITRGKFVGALVGAVLLAMN
jgi:hypothetical protein